MSSLKDNINDIADYFRGLDYYNDALMVKVQFPPQVTVMGDESKGIKVTKSQEDGLWYYYANKNDVEVEDIFDLIKTTVYVYEEAKKKAQLYRAKCDELKEIFGSTPYEQLLTLSFVYKSKKKPTRKKKKEETNETQNTSE